MDNERLIEAVQKRTPIYDKYDPNYSNRNFVKAQWKEIGEEINCNDLEARKKWTQIRDYFQKMHREITIKSESGVTSKKKWYLYDRLTFLIPYVSDRKSSSYTSWDEENSEDMDDALSHASLTSFSCAQNMEMIETEASEEPPIKQWSQKRPFSQETKRKKTESYIDWETLKAIQKLDNEQDEDELFLRSLAPKMKLMNTYQKMECQAEMSMLILKHLKLSESRSAYCESGTK